MGIPKNRLRDASDPRAVARRRRELKLEELARRTAVPQSVLEQVMPTMRTAGIYARARAVWRLPARQESGGDHPRARRPALPGAAPPISCATRHNPEPCPMMVGCTLRDVWEEVRDAAITLLGVSPLPISQSAQADRGWIRRCSRPSRRPRGRFRSWPSRPTVSWAVDRRRGFRARVGRRPRADGAGYRGAARSGGDGR